MLSLIVKRSLLKQCQDSSHCGRASFPAVSKCLWGPGSLGRWGRVTEDENDHNPSTSKNRGTSNSLWVISSLSASFTLGDITQDRASYLHKSDSLGLKKVLSSVGTFHLLLSSHKFAPAERWSWGAVGFSGQCSVLWEFWSLPDPQAHSERSLGLETRPFPSKSK